MASVFVETITTDVSAYRLHISGPMAGDVWRWSVDRFSVDADGGACTVAMSQGSAVSYGRAGEAQTEAKDRAFAKARARAGKS